MKNFKDVIQFWFGENPQDPLSNQNLWFKKDPQFDALVTREFQETLEIVVLGDLSDWIESPQRRLGLILLLDQFSRHIYRHDYRCYAQDELALRVAMEGIEKGFDQKLSLVGRWFFYMPFQHSEKLPIQQQSLHLFKNLRDSTPPEWKSIFEGVYHYAVKHFEIVNRFGRFPHRNILLGRANTPEETEFLKTAHSSF